MRRAALLAALLSTAVIVPASAASASVLWTADAEHPTSQEWANAAAQESSRVQRITSPVAQGNYAYSLELRPGDNPGGYGERCELGMGNPTAAGFPLFNENDERWIAFQVYLPSDYPINARSWNDILQLKQLGSLGTPAVSMGVERGRFTFKDSATNHEDSQPTVEEWSGPATQNRWIKFVMHVKFSANASVGFVELYGDLDGTGTKPLMARTFMHTMKEQGGAAVQSHARIGQYRDPSMGVGVSHIYFDGYTIATDRTSAEGNGFAPAGYLAPASIASIDVASTPVAERDRSQSQPVTPVVPGQSRARRATTASRSVRTRRARHARRRVWLRERNAASPVATGHLVRQIVGGVVNASGSVPGRVVIEARRSGKWSRVATASDVLGSFSVRLTLGSGVTRLGAFAVGVGYSPVLRVA